LGSVIDGLQLLGAETQVDLLPFHTTNGTAPVTTRRLAMLAIAAAALFIIGAFAADGHALLGWPALTWLLIGLACWVLEAVVPIAIPGRRA
jgi:hypothetical protein